MTTIPQAFSQQMVEAMLAKIDYSVFCKAAASLGLQVPQDAANLDEEGYRLIHHALFEVHVIEGELHCPLCQTVYPVSNGIPDFVH
ncbi:TRM112-like protein [Gregarina niphandrodes]|uniref:TRM112-like protein n=1 Tax=Gregarina niphandrodes TaxID=110365 RepID=A0A023AZG4_GRENI|nr:TRM112-like protein [Gregarina niphandrodes]EZG44169.1 TRM112-like protein [Gregarina niphandrodes]|eukprot:XP_011132780.1 TRM112-like protein [Gregarina niphandrodes]